MKILFKEVCAVSFVLISVVANCEPQSNDLTVPIIGNYTYNPDFGGIQTYEVKPLIDAFSGELSKTLNDVFEITNNGAGTITFYAVPPTGGAVTFEASFDSGVNWESISVRSIDENLWKSDIAIAGNYIGSVSGASRLRIRTSTGGSANGTVSGDLTYLVSIIEGIEFGSPPHSFGYTPIHVDAHYTNAQTGTIIFSADADKFGAVTDFYLIVSGSTDCQIRVYDETDSTGHYIFNASIEVSTNKNFAFGHSFVTPFVTSAKGNSWKITTTANCAVDLIGHGYQF